MKQYNNVPKSKLFFFPRQVKGMTCSSENFVPAVDPLLYLGLYQGEKKKKKAI